MRTEEAEEDCLLHCMLDAPVHVLIYDSQSLVGWGTCHSHIASIWYIFMSGLRLSKRFSLSLGSFSDIFLLIVTVIYVYVM